MFDADWRLTYPGEDFVFGSGAREIFNLTTPEFGDVEIRAADAVRARADGVDFGVDFLGGQTITFDLGIRGATEEAVRANLTALRRAWRADAVRSTPGALAELRSRYRGIERVTFGRPRRFAANLSEVKTARLGAVVADFACASDQWFSPEVFSQSIGLVPATGGGLLAPLSAPLTTTANTDRSVELEVSSELPVWPVITISGGFVGNPVVEVVGLWRLELRGNVDYDQTLVIDTQPWRRSVLLDGASVAGRLARRSTRLGNASIPPGTYELSFSGGSATNTATATISWRSVHSTP